MGVLEVYVDLAFCGRLRKADTFRQAEIGFLIESLSEFGLTVLETEDYCTVTRVIHADDGVTWYDIVIRTRGVWSPVFLKMMGYRDVVVFDRRPIDAPT